MKAKCMRTVWASLLAWFLLTSAVLDGEAQIFLLEWGEPGNADGQFSEPSGIAIDSSGNIYVADSLNNRIQKFDDQGTFILKWGSAGSGIGQFDSPQGIAIDSSDCVYVVDRSNNRIQKFDHTGKFIAAWGSPGSANGNFDQPFGIAVDSSDVIYVTDSGNDRVQKFDSSGSFLSSWGATGSGTGQFVLPQAIAIASAGDYPDTVYVGDATNRIQRFDPEGSAAAAMFVDGRNDGQLKEPRGIAANPNSHLIVSDCGNSRIQDLWPVGDGGFETKWGIFGRDEGQFDRPSGVAVTTSATVYVVDSGNNRIQVFGPPSPPTHTMRDFAWTLSWSDNRIIEESGYSCEPADDTVGDIRPWSPANPVTLVFNGGSYSGYVDGANYQVSRTYSGSNGEIISEQLNFTLTSQTSGSGYAFIGKTDNAGSFCRSEGDLTLTGSIPTAVPPLRPVENGGILGGGIGGGGCFIGVLTR
ncbi:MAG: 6-bladed beta-propeller [Hyphomicrobiales bacterium]